MADARNKGLALCADLIAYLLYYADIRSRQNICFTPNNSDLTELQRYTLGTTVDIKSYRTSNPFICPSDGYVIMGSTSTADSYSYAVSGSVTLGIIRTTTANRAQLLSVMVKKGMQIATGQDNNGTLLFAPFISAE